MIIGIVLGVKLVLEPIWMGFYLSIGQVLYQHISNRMRWIDKLDVEGMAPTVPRFLCHITAPISSYFTQLGDEF